MCYKWMRKWTSDSLSSTAYGTTCSTFRPNYTWRIPTSPFHMSNEKRSPGCLGYVKDNTTQLYRNYFINHDIRIPIRQAVFQWKVGGFFRPVVALPPQVVARRNFGLGAVGATLSQAPSRCRCRCRCFRERFWEVGRCDSGNRFFCVSWLSKTPFF